MTVPPSTPEPHNRPVSSDVPLILENLLCQIEELRATDGDEGVIADLLAQVELVQGR